MKWWLILLIYMGGIVAVTLEVFAPGMVLGIIGIIAIGAAIFLAYLNEYNLMGHVFVAITVLSVPIFFWMWKSFVSRFMTLKTSEAEFSAARSGIEDLVGSEGVAWTILRPSGVAKINGKRVDVVTRGQMVAKGTPVRVVDVSGNQVVVKPL